VDGNQVAAFQEISGLDHENTPIEYREGADKMNTVRKLHGIEKYPNVVCKRGVTGSVALWNIRKAVRDGDAAFPPTHVVTIQLLDEQHQPVFKWKLTNAWCTKMSGPSLNAKGNEIAIETMEWAHDRIDIE